MEKYKTCVDCYYGNCNHLCYKCKYQCAKRQVKINKNGDKTYLGKCVHDRCDKFKMCNDLIIL